MTNEQKAAEISNNISYEKDRQSVAYRAAMRMAEWKNEQQKALIEKACTLYKSDIESICNVLHRAKLGDFIYVENSVNQFRISLNEQINDNSR